MVIASCIFALLVVVILIIVSIVRYPFLWHTHGHVSAMIRLRMPFDRLCKKLKPIIDFLQFFRAQIRYLKKMADLESGEQET